MTSLQFDMGSDASAPIDMLEQYFASHNWSFERDGDEEIVTTVKGSWSDYELRALWREDDRVLQFIALTGINATAARGDPETRANLFETLALVNEQLWIGHFDIWQAEGVVMYRNTLLLAGQAEVTNEQMEALIETAVDTCERHRLAFDFAVRGGRNAKDALALALMETVGEA